MPFLLQFLQMNFQGREENESKQGEGCGIERLQNTGEAFDEDIEDRGNGWGFLGLKWQMTDGPLKF